MDEKRYDAGIGGVILDLDGTVYLGDKEVPGAARFVAWLAEQGIPYLFVTNRANRPPEMIRDHLRGYGVDCGVEHILTSAQATARYLGEGSVYCVGEAGLLDELSSAGLELREDAVDYVVVSYDRGFTYDKLAKACRLIDEGATYIATNPDKALRMEHGLSPGTGAIVAAVTAGCDVEPKVIGKPERLIMDMGIDQLGLPAEQVIAVGDNMDTDVLAAHRAGIRTALMLTGISRREDVERSPVKPTWVCETYDELMDILSDA